MISKEPAQSLPETLGRTLRWSSEMSGWLQSWINLWLHYNIRASFCNPLFMQAILMEAELRRRRKLKSSNSFQAEKLSCGVKGLMPWRLAFPHISHQLYTTEMKRIKLIVANGLSKSIPCKIGPPKYWRYCWLILQFRGCFFQ